MNRFGIIIVKSAVTICLPGSKADGKTQPQTQPESARTSWALFWLGIAAWVMLTVWAL